ncbi:MAG TPA: exodeoxyribonuclease VII small subunit [Anaerolineae bacterium]|nr:exodeoxyribonuclease VII small subunit [Anaerolineae bacterium]
MKNAAKTKAIEGLTFEQAFKELEESVTKLESGELPLEEALTLYERGQALAAYSGMLLDAAELKIEKLGE